mgnify:CR=1 FL=1
MNDAFHGEIYAGDRMKYVHSITIRLQGVILRFYQELQITHTGEKFWV